jgi:two-component system KDP operon response regulator KdpE
MAATVLVVEDERKLRELVRSYLERAGFTVLTTDSGAEALTLAGSASPDLVILDLGLPDVAGETVARELRAAGPTPILMLTARSTEEDRIRGLELGADDYVTKPFSVQELLARVRAHLRRAPERETAAIEVGDFVVDSNAHSITLQGKPVHLTPKEFDLLLHLARHAGKVITHRALLTAVWGAQSAHQPEYLRVFVGQLRKKLESETGKQYIQTEPWVGYRFVPEGLIGSEE